MCVHRESDGDIPTHFYRVHLNELDSLDLLKMIPFSYRDLMELNAVGKHDLWCLACKRSYATQIDFNQHHLAKHSGEEKKIGEVKVICCFCGNCIKNDTFLVHVKKCGIFKCHKCRNFQAKTSEIFLNHIIEMHSTNLSHEYYLELRRSLMDRYLSMRCIFENGLVLTKRNLVSSRFDDKKEFMNLIAVAVNELRTLAKGSGLEKS